MLPHGGKSGATIRSEVAQKTRSGFLPIFANREPVRHVVAPDRYEELSVFGALSAFRVKGTPVEIPCAALTVIVLQEAAENTCFTLHDRQDAGCQPAHNCLEEPLERSLNIVPEFILMLEIECAAWLTVKLFEKLETRVGEGGSIVGLGFHSAILILVGDISGLEILLNAHQIMREHVQKIAHRGIWRAELSHHRRKFRNQLKT